MNANIVGLLAARCSIELIRYSVFSARQMSGGGNCWNQPRATCVVIPAPALFFPHTFPTGGFQNEEPRFCCCANAISVCACICVCVCVGWLVLRGAKCRPKRDENHLENQSNRKEISSGDLTQVGTGNPAIPGNWLRPSDWFGAAPIPRHAFSPVPPNYFS